MIIPAIVLIIVVGLTIKQVANMRRTHNKPWSEYGTRRPFQVVNGIYTDLDTGRVFNMGECPAATGKKGTYKRGGEG
jgi:hypothetical protein